MEVKQITIIKSNIDQFYRCIYNDKTIDICMWFLNKTLTEKCPLLHFLLHQPERFFLKQIESESHKL